MPKTSNLDLDLSFKSFLNLKVSQRSPAYQNTLENFCRDLIDHANQLAKNYSISESETIAIRAAAMLYTLGLATDPLQPSQSALSLAPGFFKENEQFTPVQTEAVECLNSLNTKNKSNDITFREIFYDAVLSMDAQKDYEDRLILKNSLYGNQANSSITSLEWIKQEIENLKTVEFKTFAGQVTFGRRLERNLSQVRELKCLFEGNGLPEEHEKKLLTLYRSISRNMIDMISIADKKAGLLLSANAISLSLVVSFLSRGVDNHPRLWLSSILIAGTCALTVLFASLAARPLSRSSKALSLKELLENQSGILHYGNAARLDLKDFTLGFRQVMNDNQLLEEGLIEELHFYSKRIIEKLKMVRIAYMTMFSGIFMSFLALLFSKYL